RHCVVCPTVTFPHWSGYVLTAITLLVRALASCWREYISLDPSSPKLPLVRRSTWSEMLIAGDAFAGSRSVNTCWTWAKACSRGARLVTSVQLPGTHVAELVHWACGAASERALEQ